MAKVLVLGMGNRFLCDDGAGPRVISELRAVDLPGNVTLEQTGLDGLNLTEFLAGHDHAVIVDALHSGREPGELLRLKLHHLAHQPAALLSEHTAGILKALKIGRDLGLYMPSAVDILAIEAADVRTFSEFLTPEVESAVPSAVNQIRKKLEHIKASTCAA